MDLNRSSNITSRQTTYSTVRFSLALVFLLTSFIANSLVICAIYRFRRLRSCSNLIILNLSVADVLFTLIVAPINGSYWAQNKDTIGVVSCLISAVSSILFGMVSIYTLVFVSVERFVATNYPLKHRQVFNTKLVRIGVSIIWIWSGLLCGLPFVLTRYVYIEGFFHCSIDWSDNMAFTIIFLTCAYLLPVLTLIFCNIYIFRAVRISQRSRASYLNSQDRRISNTKLWFARDRKASFCIIVIVATFVICWTPYAIASLEIFLGSHVLPARFMSAAVLLTIGNASFNPVIYGVMNYKFREAFRNILCPGNSNVRPF
ncbi:melanopsin-like [Dendronephthya gigantea]|uniref:melanopsin-like n=1 Tax=Dendronephthya gigantea TaxID=151771 RepID=UPI0010698F0E|nr:melanopsin-like [Dendronephthya gigantea]